MLTLAPRACALYKVIILGVAALVDVDNPGAHGDGRGERLNWEADEVELQREEEGVEGQLWREDVLSGARGVVRVRE